MTMHLGTAHELSYNSGYLNKRCSKILQNLRLTKLHCYTSATFKLQFLHPHPKSTTSNSNAWGKTKKEHGNSPEHTSSNATPATPSYSPSTQHTRPTLGRPGSLGLALGARLNPVNCCRNRIKKKDVSRGTNRP